MNMYRYTSLLAAAALSSGCTTVLKDKDDIKKIGYDIVSEETDLITQKIHEQKSPRPNAPKKTTPRTIPCEVDQSHG